MWRRGRRAEPLRRSRDDPPSAPSACRLCGFRWIRGCVSESHVACGRCGRAAGRRGVGRRKLIVYFRFAVTGYGWLRSCPPPRVRGLSARLRTCAKSGDFRIRVSAHEVLTPHLRGRDGGQTAGASAALHDGQRALRPRHGARSANLPMPSPPRARSLIRDADGGGSQGLGQGVARREARHDGRRGLHGEDPRLGLEGARAGARDGAWRPTRACEERCQPQVRARPRARHLRCPRLALSFFSGVRPRET